MICSRPTPAGRCPRGQARARRRQHIAGSLCPSYTGLSAESASTRARLAHGTYSLRQRCAQLAVRDSSGPMLVGRRAADSQSDQRTCCAWRATRYPGGLDGSVVGILFLRELWHRLSLVLPARVGPPNEHECRDQVKTRVLVRAQ
jgi:hypothetical protein